MRSVSASAWQPKYCRECGTALAVVAQADESRDRLACPACLAVDYLGPVVLIETVLATRDSLLLVQRAQPPYAGMWAPVTGFVEAGETLEQAAVREVREEVGIALNVQDLIPTAIVSVQHMNQIYCAFIAFLDEETPPIHDAREIRVAKWFTQDTLPRDIWDPARNADLPGIYGRLKTRHFEFRQGTSEFCRLIDGRGSFRYIWTQLQTIATS